MRLEPAELAAITPTQVMMAPDGMELEMGKTDIFW